jgi:hypothetical protein
MVYFPFYTDPWIAESDFNPAKDRYITHQQARAIDSAIDQYIEAIVEHVRAARTAGRDWYVFDLAGVLDAFRPAIRSTSRMAPARMA